MAKPFSARHLLWVAMDTSVQSILVIVTPPLWAFCRWEPRVLGSSLALGFGQVPFSLESPFLHLQWKASVSLMYEAGHPKPMLCDTWRDRVGREVGGGSGRGDTRTPTAGSYWCMAKKSQYCNYPPIKIKFKFIYLLNKLINNKIKWKATHNEPWAPFSSYLLQTVVCLWYVAASSCGSAPHPS